MDIGVPRETSRARPGSPSAGVRELTSRGYWVVVERGAGDGSRIADDGLTRARGRDGAQRGGRHPLPVGGQALRRRARPRRS